VRWPWRKQDGAGKKSVPDSTEPLAAGQDGVGKGVPGSTEPLAAGQDGVGESIPDSTEPLAAVPGHEQQEPIKRSPWQRLRRRVRRWRKAPRRLIRALRRLIRSFRRLVRTIFIRAPRRSIKAVRRLIKAPGRRVKARRKERDRRRKEKARGKKKKRKKSAWANWKAMPRIWPYLKPYRGLATMTIILTVFGAAIALAEPWPLALVLDSVLGDKSPPSLLQPLFGASPDPYDLLIFIVAIGFAITVLSQGLNVISQYVSVRLEENMILGLRSDLFEHCQRLSLTFHDSEFTGRLMSRINIQAGAMGQITLAFP
jgi:hypothetical protein